MSGSQTMENLVAEIQSMDRIALTAALNGLQCQFPMDFSPEFLSKCSEDKLRHILLAAHLYARRDRRT